MNRYVAIFTAVNAALTVTVAVLTEVLKVESGSGLAIVAVLAASIAAAAVFARDHARPPTSEESAAFAWRSLLTTWLVSLVLISVALTWLAAPEELQSMARMFRSGMVVAFAVGAVVVTSAIYYVAIRWSFAWYAKLAARRQPA